MLVLLYIQYFLMDLDLNFFCRPHFSFVLLNGKKVMLFCCFTWLWLWCDFIIALFLNISKDSPLNFIFSSLLLTINLIENLLQPCIVSVFLDQFLYCLKILNYFKCMIFVPIVISCIVIDAHLQYNVSNWFICFLFFHILWCHLLNPFAISLIRMLLKFFCSLWLPKVMQQESLQESLRLLSKCRIKLCSEG